MANLTCSVALSTNIENVCTLPLEPWQIVRTQVGDEVTLTLAPGLRPAQGPGIVLLSEVDGEQTWGLEAQVSGQTEAQIVWLGDAVYILG